MSFIHHANSPYFDNHLDVFSMKRQVDHKEDIKVGIGDLNVRISIVYVVLDDLYTLLDLQQTGLRDNYTRVQSVKRTHQDAFSRILQSHPIDAQYIRISVFITWDDTNFTFPRWICICRARNQSIAASKVQSTNCSRSSSAGTYLPKVGVKHSMAYSCQCLLLCVNHIRNLT